MQPPDQPLLNPLFTNPLTPYQQLLTAPRTQSTGQNLQQLVVRERIIRYIGLLTSILIAATAPHLGGYITLGYSPKTRIHYLPGLSMVQGDVSFNTSMVSPK
ncbi:hypothetical protein BDR04DRAFT_1095649 [Suillus decipiens]|nr:hypothetical protein BDR04DRAFT_1095649 [Suillus decipiens]